MATTSVQGRMAAGQKIANGWMSIGSGYAAEVLSFSAFDCITVDAQRGMLGRDSIVSLLQGISVVLPSLWPVHPLWIWAKLAGFWTLAHKESSPLR